VEVLEPPLDTIRMILANHSVRVVVQVERSVCCICVCVRQ